MTADNQSTLTQNIQQVNSRLLETNSILELLQVLRKEIAPNARVILTEFDYTTDGHVQSALVPYLIDDDGVRKVGAPLHEQVPVEQLNDMVRRWLKEGTEIEFFEDLPATSFDLVPVRDFLVNQGAKSVVGILVPNGSQHMSHLTLQFNPQREFDEEFRELINSIHPQIKILIQNRRLLTETEQAGEALQTQVRRLQMLNRYVNMTSETTSEHELLSRTAQSFVEILGIDHSGITLIDPDRQTATVIAEYPSVGAVGLQIEAQGPTWTEMRRTKQALVIYDIENSDLLLPKSKEALTQSGVKSLVVLPLLSTTEELIGTIGLDIFSEGYVFSSELVEISQTMLYQITIALQRVRLLESAQRQTLQLQRIEDFSQESQMTFETANIVKAALGVVGDLLPSSYISIILFNERKQQLETVGRQYKGRMNVNIEQDQQPMWVEDTITEYTWQSQQQQLVHDIKNSDVNHPLKDELGSLLAIPLTSRGNQLGVLEVGSPSIAAYSENDIAIFMQFVNQLSVALDNVKNYTQAQRTAEIQTLVNEITLRLEQEADIHGILEVTLVSLGQALKAKRGRIRMGVPSPESLE